MLFISLFLKDDFIDSKYRQLHRKKIWQKFLTSRAFFKFDSILCWWSESKGVQFNFLFCPLNWIDPFLQFSSEKYTTLNTTTLFISSQVVLNPIQRFRPGPGLDNDNYWCCKKPINHKIRQNLLKGCIDRVQLKEPTIKKYFK